MNEWIFVTVTLTFMWFCGWKVQRIPRTMNLYWFFPVLAWCIITGIITLYLGIFLSTPAFLSAIIGGPVAFGTGLFYPLIWKTRHLRR